MSSAYFASFVLLEVIIDAPGEYLTRCGERVTIERESNRHDADFGERDRAFR